MQKYWLPKADVNRYLLAVRSDGSVVLALQIGTAPVTWSIRHFQVQKPAACSSGDAGDEINSIREFTEAAARLKLDVNDEQLHEHLAELRRKVPGSAVKMILALISRGICPKVLALGYGMSLPDMVLRYAAQLFRYPGEEDSDKMDE